MPTPTRDRLVTAAFELFEEQGFDGTTVEQIASRAGTGRTTFFRHFDGKEGVVFPAHDLILEQVHARLSTATPATRHVALREAARIVLEHYLSEGEMARARYRLTRAVPALRAREVASVHRYQRQFTRHLLHWLSDDADGPLRAELVAAGIVTAHNHVLRTWLQDPSHDPRAELDAALDIALTALTAGTDDVRTTVIVTGSRDVELVVRRVRDALATHAEPTPDE